MKSLPPNHSVAFFDAQFERQIASNAFELNPFEQAILPFVGGDVLDLGCGLGNLSVAAARAGSSVLALDGSAHAIAALQHRARAENLAITAELHELAAYDTNCRFDTVLCVGLLMFFAPPVAEAWLLRLPAMVRPNGIAAVNVLIEGTTYLEMFDQGAYTLFSENRLRDAFQGWHIEYEAINEFEAPGATVKRFSTIVARNPSL